MASCQKLYCIEREPIKENKILITLQLHSEVFESLNSAHQGVNGMLKNVTQCLFWLGLDAND